jgi:hypothetical protein
MSDPELVVHPQLRWDRPFAAALSAFEGSRNCACAVAAGVVEWATRGAQQPTHHAFRIAAGNPKDGAGDPIGLSSKQVLQAYLHFGVDATRHFGASFAVAREALQNGHAVSLCIHYPFINANAPKLSGQKTFKSGHHVALLGWTPDDLQVGGANSTVVHDPLFDGRTKSWGTAPLGPQVAPFPVYRGAMGAFRVGGPTYAQGSPIGVDSGVFLVVRRAPASATAMSSSGPGITVAQLAAEKAELESQLTLARDRIARLQQKVSRAKQELDEPV